MNTSKSSIDTTSDVQKIVMEVKSDLTYSRVVLEKMNEFSQEIKETIKSIDVAAKRVNALAGWDINN